MSKCKGKRKQGHPAKVAAEMDAAFLASPEERRRREYQAYGQDYRALVTEARSMGASPQEIPPFVPKKKKDRIAQLAEHMGISPRKVREMIRHGQIQLGGSKGVTGAGNVRLRQSEVSST